MTYRTEVPPRHPEHDPVVRVERLPQPGSSYSQGAVPVVAWEYQHLAQQIGAPALGPAELDTLGVDGWELVGVVTDSQGVLHFYFKRPQRPSR
jgi:hypothetical protein